MVGVVWWLVSRGLLYCICQEASKKPTNGPLLGLFYRSQLKSDQPTTGGGGRVVKERLPRALPWPPNAFHTTLVAYLVILECFDSDRRRWGVVEGCN